MDGNKFISNESLIQFFYKDLDKINKKSVCPLPHEFILYSSEVLNDYALSDRFFQTQEGRVNEKVLGINFLEATHKSPRERKEIYKDVGDTVLVQLGFFSERVKRKGPDPKYYIHLGKSAYAGMEKLNASFYDIPNFYNLFSSSLEQMVNLLVTMRESHNFDSFEQYLLEGSEEYKNLFIHITSKKVS